MLFVIVFAIFGIMGAYNEHGTWFVASVCSMIAGELATYSAGVRAITRTIDARNRILERTQRETKP
jgi:uncharacterized membrane protein